MAALSRRDIEMIFRAETDKATRPIADLSKAVKSARNDLDALVEAAAKGDVSLDKLGKTTTELKKAQDELGTARGLLTQLNAQEAALDKAQAKVDETGQKYRDLAERVAGAEKPTKVLTNSLAAAERSFNAAQERLSQVAAEAAATRVQIEGVIGPVTSVNDGFRTIAETSREIGRGLAVAGSAADEFKAKMTQAAISAADVEKKLNADVNFEQQGRSAGLLQAQIDYISQFENRVELLATAKRELTQQNAAFDQALTAQEAKTGAVNVERLRQSIADTFAEATRLESVNAFRQQATEAAAAIANVDRFAASQTQAAGSGQRLAAALGEILNPARAVVSTLDGIEASVTAAAGVLEGKGRKTASEYAAALNELSAAGAGIGRVAQSIDAFRDQQRAVEKATTAFREAQTEATRLATALAEVDEPTQQMANDLKKAEANLTTAGNAMQEEKNKLVALSAALQKAGIDTADLDRAQKRLTASATEAGAAAKEVSARAGGKTGGGLFGLTPNDATNLSYQINDIFTQLASGQSIFITLAQQGPQIWQIEGIKKYVAGLGELLPIIGLTVVAVGAMAYAFAEADKQAKTLDAANGYLATLGEAGSLSATQIARTALEMENLGVKTADARKLLADFNEGGLDPQYLQSFVEASRNAAEVTGVDFKDAFGALNEAMNGGYEEVMKLLEQFPVLTDAEQAHIKKMFESGQASEARREVFEKFYAKMQEGADNMRGPWGNAVLSFKNSFKDFFDYLSKVGIAVVNTFKSNMADALNGLNYLILRARGFAAEQARLQVINGANPKAPTGGGGPAGSRRTGTSAEGQTAIQDAKDEANLAKGLNSTNKALRDKARLLKAEQAARLGAPKQATDAERNELASLAVAKERLNINSENAKISARAAKKDQTARDKAAREAETLANKIKSQADSLEAALDSMGVKVAKISAGTLQDQLAAAAEAVQKQYAAELRKLDDFAKLTGGKGKIGGRSINEARDEIKQNETVLTQQAQLKVYEDNVNKTLAERKSLLADIEDKASRGEITSAEAITKTQEVTSKYAPIIESLVSSAKAFAISIGGASPSAELTAFIAKLDSAGNKATGDSQTDNKKEATTRIGAEETKLNQIIAQRNNLVSTYNTLQQLGVLTASDARKKSAEAYKASQDEIAKQSEVLRNTVEAGKNLIDPQVYDQLIAKLQEVGAQAEYIDPRFAQLKQSISNVVAQDSMQAIDKIADAFGRAAAGTESWGDALKDAGNALLEMVLNIIKQTARIIIQALLLQAIDKLTNGFVKLLLQAEAGGNGDGGSGGGGGKGLSIFGLKLFHGGGTVGNALSGQQTSNRIQVSPAAIAAAPRYHTGTPSVGLKRDEQVAVLQKGEKVVTEEQQRREAAQKSAGGGGSRSIRNVLAVGDDQVAAAMSGPHGEDVVLTHLKRNQAAVKQLVQE